MGDGGRIFISYSHADAASVALLPRLQNQLAFLSRFGIEVWDDRQIETGTAWKKAIDDAIANARAAIVLISPTYLGSQWVLEKELPALRAAVDENRIALFPLLVTDCAWDRTELSDVQLCNTKPLGRIRANAAKDAILAELARKIDAALRQPEPERVPEPVVIAVMGAKGGVGKGTFTTCVAHLFAGAGIDVAMIDCDLQDAGTTREAVLRRRTDVITLRTAYQHIAPHSQGFERHLILSDESLWDVTPPALAATHKGHVWLLPSSTSDEKIGGWDIVANIPPPREEALETVLREMIARIRAQTRARVILIDCGAGTNPLYSAAFAVAKYGYIVVLPDASYFGAIQDIKSGHRLRYPQAELNRIFVVANMVTSARDRVRLDTIRPVAMIPRNPLMQEDQFNHPIDFELGYDDVTAEVYGALAKTFESDDVLLLPDPITVHVRPWWNLLVSQGIARRALKNRRLRVARWALWAAVATLVAVSGVLFAFLIATSLEQPVDALPLFHAFITYFSLAQLLLIAVAMVLAPLEKKTRLLKRISMLQERTPEELRLLHEMLDRKDRETMQWLRALARPPETTFS